MAKYELDTLRHSTAHLMAQAIMELFPKDSVQLGIGPTIENGFYYDIEMNSKLTEEHLKQIEEKMKEIFDSYIDMYLDHDTVLDKINMYGMTSLSERDKKVLESTNI